MNSFLDPVELSLASKGLRFANYFIDYIITTIIQYAILILPIFWGNEFFNSAYFGIISFFIALGIYVFYYAITESFFKGKTIAKFITGTKAVTVDGDDLNFNNALIRSLCRLIPFDAFSFIGETGWHDSISKTRVVKTSDFIMNKIKFNSIDEIGREIDPTSH